MAAFDIMPFRSPLGGVFYTLHGEMNASEVFDTGEVVFVDGSGEVAEAPQDVTQVILADATGTFGIAAYGPAGGAQTNDRAAHINPKTGVAFTTSDDVGVWPSDRGIEFITSNFFAAAAGAAATPDAANIGQSYQITYATYGTPDAGWGVEETAATAGTDLRAIVSDVLDTNKRSIRDTGQTGVYVVFDLRTT